MTYRNSGRPVYWSMWSSENTDDSDMYPSELYAITYLMTRLNELITSLNIHGKVFLVPQNWNQNSDVGRRLTKA